MEVDVTGVDLFVENKGYLSHQLHTLLLSSSSLLQETDKCNCLVSLSCPMVVLLDGLSCSVHAGIQSGPECWELRYTLSCSLWKCLCLTPVPFLSQSHLASVGVPGTWMYRAVWMIDIWTRGSLKALDHL